ncbi:putative Carbon monoxide dehydrogenase subunit G [Nostocoides australiense Ben110]|uniref:Putative Carbon monoxide dehydrogenase subunit G n=1 Tax=Nostocoides australiense Ben110 TaxID=1193182 RepID=W6K473_9MICO|nr:SRPBCC family protein [Tetrasphaera australiensis]CCH74514.1 putative Carbon monoxide dehydrogenase subunit G [Tetrasphaera australiensis Ben110]
MKFSNEIRVSAPRDRVWEILHDVEAVVACLPGAEITGKADDGALEGAMRSKLGPLSLTFAGKARLTYDENASNVTIAGSGVDKRGGSRANVTVVAGLRPQGEATDVTLESDLTLSGNAAQFGRTGLLEEVAGRILEEFAACLEGKLAAHTPEQAAQIAAAPPSGIRLFFAALIAQIRRLVHGRSRRPRGPLHDSRGAI